MHASSSMAQSRAHPLSYTIRRRHLVRKVHRLGPRAIVALLNGLGQKVPMAEAIIDADLEALAGLDRDLLERLDASRVGSLRPRPVS